MKSSFRAGSFFFFSWLLLLIFYWIKIGLSLSDCELITVGFTEFISGFDVFFFDLTVDFSNKMHRRNRLGLVGWLMDGRCNWCRVAWDAALWHFRLIHSTMYALSFLHFHSIKLNLWEYFPANSMLHSIVPINHSFNIKIDDSFSWFSMKRFYSIINSI